VISEILDIAEPVAVAAASLEGPLASEGVSAVFAIIKAFADGTTSADDAKVQLAAIPVERAKNNAAADEIVKERFHPDESK
jgi:hypothetical protein